MSPKNLENISNFEGWRLALVAYKRVSILSFQQDRYMKSFNVWITNKQFGQKWKEAKFFVLKRYVNKCYWIISMSFKNRKTFWRLNFLRGFTAECKFASQLLHWQREWMWLKLTVVCHPILETLKLFLTFFVSFRLFINKDLMKTR